MTNRFTSALSRTLGCLAVFAAMGITGRVAAQQTIRTGDGFLEIQTNMPEEVRIGEQFTYTVRVTNASDNTTLHDISLQQRKADGFTIESTSMNPSKNANSAQSGSNSNSNQATQEKGNSADGEMNIDMLMPGESREIQVKAAADNEGALKSCLEIVNYKPALCMTSQVVKPELSLTKNAPDKVNRCDVIELNYSIANGGSGDVGKFQVVDELGDGLATIDGNSTLKFDVDGLRAGDTREFIARVYATKSGKFSSRAEAKASNSDLSARSKQTTTEVITADLDVKLDGPSRLYGDQLARFNARVTNTGNAAAEDVSVTVMWPQDSNLVDMGDPQMRSSNSSNSSSGDSADSTKGQPEMADKNKQQQKSANGGDSQSDSNSKNASDSSNSQSESQQVAMNSQEFSLERLEPGQTATFEYAVRPGGRDTLPTRVQARHVCTVDEADDEAQARSEATSTAFAETKVVRLPALQMVVFDDEDPVSDGSQVTYMIRVWNEGDAEDSDIQLTATLPEGLKFENAEGPTEHSADGREITFDKLDTLAAGDQLDFKVMATSTGSGDVRFKAELTSKSLDSGVTSEEPTRLFAGQASN